MPAEIGAIPFLSDIGLLITYKCQVVCPHCIVQASPQRKEQIRVAEAYAWIRQLAAYRSGWVRILALTGGEPFYDLGLLKAIAQFARSCGVTVTAVTNAFWAGSVAKAVKVLSELEEISNVAFSTDIYHQMTIPIEHVRNAVAAAEQCRRPYLVSVCTPNERDEGYLATMRRLREFTDDDHIRTATVLPVGRAALELGAAKYDTSTTPPVAACTSSSPIIFPDGRVVACIGPIIELTAPHPLLLGDLRQESVAEVFDRAQTNPVLHLIRVWGPHKLVEMVQAAGLGEFLPQRYVVSTICDTCYHLMASPQIVAYLEELARSPDLQRTVAYARAYYMEEPEMMATLGLMPAPAMTSAC